MRQRFLDRPFWFRAVTLALLVGAAISGALWVALAARPAPVPPLVEPIAVVLAAGAALIQFWGPSKARSAQMDPAALGFAGATPDSEKATFRAVSVTKVVDLRANHVLVRRDTPSGDPDAPVIGGVTLISDMYLLRRTDKLTDRAAFLYSTSGEVRGTSATHPGSSVWQPMEGEHMRRSYEMRTTISDLDVDGVVRVVNRVEYFAAFEGATSEYVETHVDRPTGSLTWVMLFAGGRPCRSCTGRVRQGRLWREERSNPPVVLEDGRMVVWQVGDSDSPLNVNDVYGLRWSWDRQSSGASDSVD